jgi:hypothetical protein
MYSVNFCNCKSVLAFKCKHYYSLSQLRHFSPTVVVSSKIRTSWFGYEVNMLLFFTTLQVTNCKILWGLTDRRDSTKLCHLPFVVIFFTCRLQKIQEKLTKVEQCQSHIRWSTCMALPWWRWCCHFLCKQCLARFRMVCERVPFPVDSL